MSLRTKRHDRTGGPVVCRLWIKPQTCDFQGFDFVAVRSFTSDGGLLQPTGGVKTTPHKTIFAVCLQGILVQNKFGTVTTSEFGTQSDKPKYICNDLKHVETHE